MKTHRRCASFAATPHGAWWLPGLLGLLLLVAAQGAQAACDPSVSCCASSGMGSP